MAVGNLAGHGPVNIAKFTADDKPTPVNADKAIIIDSQDGNKLKEVSLSSLLSLGGNGWDGEVNTFADLPVATGSGDIYLVLTASGLFWNKQPGLYRDVSPGTWERVSKVVFNVLDNEASFSDDGDNTKKMVFQLSGITTGNTRTLSPQDKSYTIADHADVLNRLVTTNNLSDLTNTTTARSNLGLGTLATQSGTFSGTSSGTNTGDQTSIVGITGTKAQFDTAVTDGNFLYVGDVTQYTDEQAQDAVGAMIDTTLTYVDGTPLLQRSALTGDVTASAGSNITTIANSSVTLAKQADVATSTVFYRKTAGTGSPEVQTLATLKTDLGLTGTNSGDQTITLTGDVTGSGTGSFSATIANNAVTLAKMATVATDSILGRATASTGNVEVLTALPFAFTGDVTRPADSNVTTIANNAVTNAKSAQMAANTVKSNATAGTADPSDLAVGTNTVVGRVAGNIVAAQLVNDQITNSTIQYAKIQNVSATDRLLGRDTAGAGVIEELTVGGGIEFTGTGIQTSAFTGDVTKTAGGTATTIANDAVTNAKLANMAASTIKGNNTGGATDPIDLTVAQTKTLLAISTADVSGLGTIATQSAASVAITGGTAVFNNTGLAIKDSDSSHNLTITTGSNLTANRNLTINPGDAARTITLNGNTTLDQAVDTTASPAFVNGTRTGYEDFTAISVPATPSSGNVRLSARTEVNRTCLRMLCDEGIDADIQSAFYHRSILMMGITNGTTNPTTVNCNGQFTATLSYVHTVASANKWLATRRKRHTTSTVAGNQSGWRINYACCYRGNAANFGGFYYVQRFGHNLNLNGSQFFAGLAGLTTALPATAGAVSALVDMIGVGYDTTDSSAGNWQFFRNDGAGTATKVDLGASALRSNVSHGYELIIFLLPNSGVFYVKITNIHDGTVLLNTSYNTDVPTANVGLCPRVEVNNGAVAAAADADHSFMYIATNF